jgi:hypothetical protein
MKESEIPICAGPRTDYVDALVSALKEVNIHAKIVLFRMLNRRSGRFGRAHLETKSTWLFLPTTVRARWN